MSQPPLTTTGSSIQGWITHMKRCVPGVRRLDPIGVVPPAGTKLNGGKKNVGGVGVPNRISFSGGTIPPPPNCVTGVSEWVSPPWLKIRTELPASIVPWPGENRHAPANLWSTSWPMKSPNVVPPSPTHVGGSPGTARLKDTGSQSSFIRIVPGSAHAQVGRSKATTTAATPPESFLTTLLSLPQSEIVRCASNGESRAGNRKSSAAEPRGLETGQHLDAAMQVHLEVQVDQTRTEGGEAGHAVRSTGDAAVKGAPVRREAHGDRVPARRPDS